MKRFLFCSLGLILAVGLIFTTGSPVLADDAPPIEWIRQFGTSVLDCAWGVATDSTGIYVVGDVGQTTAGSADVFVRKYDASGTEVWTRQFGTSGEDIAFGVATDSTGIYVVGEVGGALPGQSYIGGSDIFVRKYDASGTEVWTRQFGTSVRDCAWGVATDSTGIYVVGYVDLGSSSGSGDVFVRKYNASGTELWTRQFGTSGEDIAFGVATDSTGIYVVGEVGGALPGQSYTGVNSDAFVRKYDASGTEVWTRQFGTGVMDSAWGIAADSTGIYIAGYTGGTFPGQSSTVGWGAFVRKYDASGTEVWTRQFGTSISAFAYGVATDSTGIYVVGSNGGTLPGQSSAGSDDAFVRKYDASGTEVWTRQFGTGGADRAWGVATDASGIYIAGYTEGALPGQSNAGSYDAFIIKLSTQGLYIYSVKFLCGKASSVNVGVEPADYATAINIHNFHDETVVLRKKVVIANREGEPMGMVSPYTDNVTLGPNMAIEVDCVDICGLLGLPCGPFRKGFVVIESNKPLNIVAVYTAKTRGWCWGGMSIDVEPISPVVSP